MNLSETSDSAWEVTVERSGAFDETIVFLDYFEGLADPRQRARVVYPLDEVLLLCLLAVLAGAENIVDIARFGEKKRDFLRRFRRFADGTPSHDQPGTILGDRPVKALWRAIVGKRSPPPIGKGIVNERLLRGPCNATCD